MTQNDKFLIEKILHNEQCFEKHLTRLNNFDEQINPDNIDKISREHARENDYKDEENKSQIFDEDE